VFLKLQHLLFSTPLAILLASPLALVEPAQAYHSVTISTLGGQEFWCAGETHGPEKTMSAICTVEILTVYQRTYLAGLMIWNTYA